MSLNFCDLLVLGSDLSGVIAGTLLAKRGMNVLILDDEGDDDHASNLVTGLETRAFKSLLGKLMIPETKAQIVQENKVSCQLVLPRHRINLTPSRSLLLKEIEREFPAEKETFQEFLAAIDALREAALDPFFSFLPVCGRREEKQFSRWLRQLPDEEVISLWNKFSPGFQTFIKLQLRFLSRGSLVEPLSLQLLLYLSPDNAATFSIRGGVKELKKLFYEKLDYFGGLVHPLSSGDFEILVKGREVRGIKLNGFSFPTRCRFLMGNLNLQNFYRRLPKNLWSYFAKRKIGNLPPVESQYSVQFEINRDVLPGPMRENVVLIEDPTKPLEGLNYLELNMAPVARGDDGRAILTVGYRCPPADSRGEAYFEDLHRKIEERVRKLIPFSDPSLKRLFPKIEGGSLFPESADFPIFLNLAGRKKTYSPSLFSPSCTTPFRNAFLLGPNLLDWLGMEGKMLAALRGVELIWDRESRTKKN